MPVKILVTGGCGFVGRHLVNELAKDRENHVTIVDDLSTGLRVDDWPAHLKTAVAEVHYEDCCVYFASHPTARFDVVFHLAAVVEGRATIEGQPLKVARDLTIDATMFNWAVTAAPEKIVYFSSSAAYPIALQTRNNHVPLREDMISFSSQDVGVPDLSYGWAKLTGEFLVNLAATSHDQDIAVYRPFSGYGEDQAPTYPFPSIMRRIIDFEGGSIDVWGSGEQSRDFIYIDDCIKFIMQSFASLSFDQPLNLGSGVATTFAELIQTGCAVAGKPEPTIRPVPGTPEGVFARYCDPARQQSLNLLPSVSLEEGIATCLDFIERTED